MGLKIKNFIIAHLAQSIVVSLIVIIGIGGVVYVVANTTKSDNTKDSTSNNSTNLCANSIKISAPLIEEDPAGDSGVWLRFNYSNSADQALNCKYNITFYDSQNSVVRTISGTEDIFKSRSGQIYNGYSSTTYQEGMTTRVVIQ